jgi:hypothetical protein
VHTPTDTCAQNSFVKAVRNVSDGQATFTTDTSADAGETVEFQLTFTEGADFAADSGSISDPVPDGCTFVSCDDNDPSTTTNCTTDGPPVANITFSFGFVPAGGTKTFTFQCQLDASFPAGVNEVTNVASVTVVEHGQPEPPQDSNESTVTVVACPASCDDNNPCTDDSCNTTNGTCINTNDDTNACSDGSECTTNDACVAGACVGGAAPNCDDGNVCTDDSCNPNVAGGCVNTNNTAPCSDGSECTTGDTCSGGACVGGPAPNCNDGNV